MMPPGCPALGTTQSTPHHGVGATGCGHRGAQRASRQRAPGPQLITSPSTVRLGRSSPTRRNDRQGASTDTYRQVATASPATRVPLNNYVFVAAARWLQVNSGVVAYNPEQAGAGRPGLGETGAFRRRTVASSSSAICLPRRTSTGSSPRSPHTTIRRQTRTSGQVGSGFFN